MRKFDSMMRIDAYFRLTPQYREMNEALKIMHGFTESMIRERREELQRNVEWTDKPLVGYEALGTKRKHSILDILLQASIDERPLNNLDIREELDTFLFAVQHTMIQYFKKYELFV